MFGLLEQLIQLKDLMRSCDAITGNNLASWLITHLMSAQHTAQSRVHDIACTQAEACIERGIPVENWQTAKLDVHGKEALVDSVSNLNVYEKRSSKIEITSHHITSHHITHHITSHHITSHHTQL